VVKLKDRILVEMKHKNINTSHQHRIVGQKVRVMLLTRKISGNSFQKAIRAVPADEIVIKMQNVHITSFVSM